MWSLLVCCMKKLRAAQPLISLDICLYVKFCFSCKENLNFFFGKMPAQKTLQHFLCVSGGVNMSLKMRRKVSYHFREANNS